MKGAIIKEVLRQNRCQMKAVAEKMGTSLSNLSAGLSKDDVRTGLLEGIAEAAGIPISVFYGEAYGTVQQTATGNNNTQVAGNSNNIDNTGSVLELLKIKDEQLLQAMRQTSAAQEHASKAQEQMDRVLDKLIGA